MVTPLLRPRLGKTDLQHLKAVPLKKLWKVELPLILMGTWTLRGGLKLVFVGDFNSARRATETAAELWLKMYATHFSEKGHLSTSSDLWEKAAYISSNIASNRNLRTWYRRALVLHYTNLDLRFKQTCKSCLHIKAYKSMHFEEIKEMLSL